MAINAKTFFEIKNNEPDIHIHTPDTFIVHEPVYDSRNRKRVLATEYANKEGSTEKLRAQMLDITYNLMTKAMPYFIQEVDEQMYRYAKDTLYHIIFDLCDGRVKQRMYYLIIGISIIIGRLKVLKDDKIILTTDNQDKYINLIHRNVPNSPYTKEKLREGVEMLEKEGFMGLYLPVDLKDLAKGKPIVIRSGTFGLCTGPLCNIDPNTGKLINHPDTYVSKTFFRMGNATSALNSIKKMKELTGINNNAFNAELQTERRLGDFHPNIQAELRKSSNFLKEASNDVYLYSIIMPYLGVSIDTVTDESKKKNKGQPETDSLRACEFHTIMGQLLKCQTILEQLAIKQYLHADICAQNMMWNKDTKKFHIIDYDWLMPYDQFVEEYKNSFGHSRNPPESLLATPAANAVTKKENWIKNNMKQFLFEFKEMGVDTVDKFEREINAALDENKKWIERDTKAMLVGMKKYSFPSFDSYAYAHVMLNLFAYIYPTSTIPFTQDTFEDHVTQLSSELRGMITNNGKPYSEKYLRLIATTLLRVTDLYHKMGEFVIEKRIDAINGMKHLKEIYADFMRKHTAFTGSNNDANDIKEEVADAKKFVLNTIKEETENNLKEANRNNNTRVNSITKKMNALTLKGGKRKGRRRHPTRRYRRG